MNKVDLRNLSDVKKYVREVLLTDFDNVSEDNIVTVNGERIQVIIEECEDKHNYF